MTLRTRILVLVSALVVLAGVATASVLHASARAERRDRAQPGGPRITAGPVSLNGSRRLVFLRCLCFLFRLLPLALSLSPLCVCCLCFFVLVLL